MSQNSMKKDSIKNIEKPLVSVIIPVFNVEKYLKQCLDSVITQTYRNIEIICVDDGSTDNSYNILSFYQKKDSRIKILQQKNQGPSAARNKALEIAKGKYISFVDADDFLQWNAYEILVKVAEENKLDLIIFGANTTSDAPEWINEKINTVYRYYKNCTPEELVFNEKSARPFLWLHFIKRTILQIPTKIQFDQSMDLGEDQLFQFRYLPRVENAMVIDDKLYNYRIDRAGSLMQLYGERKIKKVNTHLGLVQKIIDAWRADGYLGTHEDNLVTWIVNFLYYSINELPMTFKTEFSKLILNIFEENDLREWLIAYYEREHFLAFKEWAISEGKELQQIEELLEKIEHEEYEISETLKSKAFRVGRVFVSKTKKLDLSEMDS